jgi:ABC-2 type transport system permease protein
VALRFGVVVALSVGLSLLGAALSGTSFSAPGAAARLALWLLVAVLYGAFWFAVAVLVAARGKGSAANAVTLAAVWLGVVVVVPGLVNLAAAAIHPTPSRALLVGAMREASNDANQRAAQILARYFQDHPELLPPGQDPDQRDFMTRFFTVEREIEAQVAPVLDRHEEALAQQQAFVARLGFLSPAILAQEALNAVAGTGAERHRRFLAQAFAFAQQKKGFFLPKFFRKERLTEADYEAMPRFAFADEATADVVRRVLPALSGLALPAAALLLLGLARLKRYPVVG